MQKLVKKEYQIPFILVTSLFFLWGFAHAILDVLNKQDVYKRQDLHGLLHPEITSYLYPDESQYTLQIHPFAYLLPICVRP